MKILNCATETWYVEGFSLHISSMSGVFVVSTMKAYSAASQHAYWSKVVLSTNVYAVVECLADVGITDQLAEVSRHKSWHLLLSIASLRLKSHQVICVCTK